MDDEQIIGLYFDRHENAIKETDIKFGRYCYTIAYNILYSCEDSEECKSDTYLKAWNTIPPKKPDNLRAFLGRIARNIALNMYEKMHRKKRDVNNTAEILDELSECIPDNNSRVEEESDYAELCSSINAFVCTLSEDNRKIFVRRYWYAEPMDKIASACGFSVGKVKTSLMRTRDKLKKYLKSEGIIV